MEKGVQIPLFFIKNFNIQSRKFQFQNWFFFFFLEKKKKNYQVGKGDFSLSLHRNLREALTS